MSVKLLMHWDDTPFTHERHNTQMAREYVAAAERDFMVVKNGIKPILRGFQKRIFWVQHAGKGHYSKGYIDRGGMTAILVAKRTMWLEYFLKLL